MSSVYAKNRINSGKMKDKIASSRNGVRVINYIIIKGFFQVVELKSER